MKKILFIAATALFSFTAKAQLTSPEAHQVVTAVMPNIITVTAPGSGATINFASATDYVDGKESGLQTFSVASNKNWQLDVKADANFVETTSLTNMPIAGGLFKIKVATSSDYTIATGFDNYNPVTTSYQTIVSTGTKGNAKAVNVTYKLTPGLTYPGGSYTNTVTYTATQL